jgi:TPR repeat protein
MKHLQRAELYEQARVQGLGKMTNSNAMYELGREYEHGIGVSQDYGKAREWYRR